jgi:hypothetical protein
MKRSVNSLRGLGLLVAAASMAGCLIPGVNAPTEDGAQARQSPGLSAARRISPAENREVLPAVLQLNWTAVSGATAYEVYLGVDTLPPLIAQVSSSSIVVRDLQSCSEQYWRVVAIVDGQRISSPTWKFMTSCD